MRNKVRRRSCKVIVAVVPFAVAFGVMFYTGFASDVGLALLYRLPMPSFSSAHAPDYYGPVSIEESILEADVIVRANLRSVSQGVDAITYTGIEDNGGWVEGEVYVNSMEFVFGVLEYLKGAGNDEIIGVVTDESVPYNTKLGARAFGENLIEIRDTAWDDREAIIFLSNPKNLSHAGETNRYWLGWISVHHGQVQDDAYTVNSRDYKKWLPAVRLDSIRARQSVSEFSDHEQHFLTSVPLSESELSDSMHQKTDKNIYGKILDTSKGTATTITLSGLRDIIAELAEELAEGDGSDMYRQCVYEKYKWEREFQYVHVTSNGSSRQLPTDHKLASGMPSGTAFGRGTWSDPDPRRLIDVSIAPVDWESWLEGEDSSLFQLGNLPIISNARPLPQGEYNYYYNERASKYIPCDAYPEARRIWNIHSVKVTAPSSTVHEAFFDPEAIGDAVGADGAKGVLKPSSFTVEGTGSVSVERIEWESDSVELELAPHEGMAGHHIDFIALDGSVALRLDFDDAVETGEGSDRALSWRVCKQPWSAGDLLMLRISASPADLSGVYDASSCVLAPTATPTAEPTHTPTPEPTATPGPLATATPVSTPTPVSTTQ